MLLGFFGGLFISALNAAGSFPVLFITKVSDKLMDVGLGFSAGVMLAASFTSLLLPALELGGIVQVLIGFAAGAVFVSISDMFIPHLHFIIGEDTVIRKRLKAVWLFAIAVMIHNMPEGLAVGVGYGSGELLNAFVLMLGIGIQNIPEGLSVALSMLSTGKYGRFKSFTIGSLSGLVEIPLALLGAALVTYMRYLLPYAMAFAAGAMVFVISDEIVPETHRKGHERSASYGLIIGFMIMLTLDVVLSG